jgi:hypothetical protein
MGRTMKDKSWHAQGSCNNHPDPDLWHYENARFADEQRLQVLRSVEAINLCNTCPVKNKCLEEGLEPENIQYWGGWGSIWGGLLMSERYRLLKDRNNPEIVTAEVRHRGNVRALLGKIA